MKERGVRIGNLINRVKDKLRRAHPMGSYVPESAERRRLRDLPYTKASSDAMDEVPNNQKIPFGDIARHRKMRGLDKK